MNISSAFRPTKSFKVIDENASAKPLSSGDKAKEKLLLEDLTAQIATSQEVFYAEHQRKILVVLQGMDTSGKDGTVKGVFGRIDLLGIRSVAFKAPSVMERERDFLWRVHAEVPAQGEIVIFNRSHYEDVLITRVHEWIDDAECKRRLKQICDFEQMLADTGTVLLKFFLHISADEQKLRLQQRIDDPDKHWKFDLQDLAERKLWADYQNCYTTAINATDAAHAPWYVIPANSKTHRNLAIASIVLETLKKMKLRYPPAKPEFNGMHID